MNAARFAFSLSDRDRSILEHVARYRLTWYPVLQQVFFSDQGATAANKVLGRLCRAGLLRPIKLLLRHQGFVLTRKSALLLGISIRGRDLPGVQSLATAFAVLHYATSARNSRIRLTRSELREAFPWMPSIMLASPHCRDVSGCLELIRVDLGGSHDHVARKCGDDIQRRQSSTPFMQLVLQGLFRLVVLTTSKTKADLIRKSLNRSSWPQGLSIRLVIVAPLSLMLMKGDSDAP